MNYDELSDRELDALVVEKLPPLRWLGWEDFWPSVDLFDAFEVVEAMRERGYGVEIHVIPQGNGVVINANPGEYNEEGVGESESESLPRAICIAALRALDA